MHIADLHDPLNAEIYAIIDGEKITLQFGCSGNTLYAEFSETYWNEGSEIQKHTLVNCRYREDKVIMRVKSDDIFGGGYKRIVLNRLS